MHEYDSDSHSFTIRSFENDAKPDEIQQAPSILLDTAFVYRRISTTHSPHITADSEKLVGLATTPARGLAHLPIDAELQFCEAENKALAAKLIAKLPPERQTVDIKTIINCATSHHVFGENSCLTDWRLSCIDLCAHRIVMQFVRLLDPTRSDTYQCAYVKLPDTTVLQMKCHLTEQWPRGITHSEHYTCSTHFGTPDNPEASFLVEYRSNNISTNPQPSQKRYAQSKITYSDSYC